MSSAAATGASATFTQYSHLHPQVATSLNALEVHERHFPSGAFTSLNTISDRVPMPPEGSVNFRSFSYKVFNFGENKSAASEYATQVLEALHFAPFDGKKFSAVPIHYDEESRDNTLVLKDSQYAELQKILDETRAISRLIHLNPDELEVHAEWLSNRSQVLQKTYHPQVNARKVALIPPRGHCNVSNGKVREQNISIVYHEAATLFKDFKETKGNFFAMRYRLRDTRSECYPPVTSCYSSAPPIRDSVIKGIPSTNLRVKYYSGDKELTDNHACHEFFAQRDPEKNGLLNAYCLALLDNEGFEGIRKDWRAPDEDLVKVKEILVALGMDDGKITKAKEAVREKVSKAMPQRSYLTESWGI